MADRLPEFKLTFGGVAEVLRIFAPLIVAAQFSNLCWSCIGAFGSTVSSFGDESFNDMPLPDIVIDSRFTVTVSYSNRQSGDGMDPVSFLLEDVEDGA